MSLTKKPAAEHFTGSADTCRVKRYNAPCGFGPWEGQMKNIEQINSEIEGIKKELNNVRGTGTEVYARIVGYYRSVRNWNKGKREEYNDRLMFSPENDRISSAESLEGVPVASQNRLAI